MDTNHILLSEDLDYTDQNGNVDGKYGRVNPALVPVGISLMVTDISGASYSYDQETDLRTISILEVLVMNWVIGHMRHLSNSTDGDVRQFARFPTAHLTLQLLNKAHKSPTLHQKRSVR
ncbi:MAG: hypothetical protein CM15mP71_3900 [Candidatus Poseidoniales archaeon]|nr:MAG: hypothetical protein CM15mP71_3900 [Candidatus Poseidoniales archaeon]